LNFTLLVGESFGTKIFRRASKLAAALADGLRAQRPNTADLTLKRKVTYTFAARFPDTAGCLSAKILANRREVYLFA
jgi:hypothetical protein